MVGIGALASGTVCGVGAPTSGGRGRGRGGRLTSGVGRSMTPGSRLTADWAQAPLEATSNPRSARAAIWARLDRFPFMIAKPFPLAPRRRLVLSSRQLWSGRHPVVELSDTHHRRAKPLSLVRLRFAIRSDYGQFTRRVKRPF